MKIMIGGVRATIGVTMAIIRNATTGMSAFTEPIILASSYSAKRYRTGGVCSAASTTTATQSTLTISSCEADHVAKYVKKRFNVWPQKSGTCCLTECG